MRRSDRKKHGGRGWLVVLLIIAPAIAVAGLQPQGLQPQGLQPQGLQPQGLQPQGLQPQGLQPQGLQPQGLQPQGLQPQGLQPQGLQPQGLQPQGLQPQGVALMGTDVLAPNFKGFAIGSVDLRGPTANSTVVGHELTSIPGVSTGLGNYIVVSGTGDPAAGRYAVAHMVDDTGAPAEDLDLYIASEAPDQVPNDFHRADQQDNQDELYVVFAFMPWSGEWISLCPYNPLTKSASAMALAETPTDPDPLKRNQFIFACTATGVASKCARNWGYRPWQHTQSYVFHDPNWVLEDQDLKGYYDVCKVAAMADYCQTGQSFTKAGTLVDLFDTRQIIWPNAIQNPFNSVNQDSLWMMAQEYFISFDNVPAMSSNHDSALQRTRYAELSPVGSPPGTCDQFAYVTRLEHDNIEDGHWASPLTNTPRIQVFSPTSCTHKESETGGVMPWDCSPCTTQVCKTMPQCCGAFGSTIWDAACVNQAAAVCQTSGVAWPSGKVWPAQADTSAVTANKYLLGPNGVVLRTDGTSGPSSAATISGWACDPEWPGASVAVQIFDGPREQGGTKLAEVRADQPISPPLLSEVSLACDGTPAGASARHGFSYTLPTNQAGNVFVYAIDAATDDGPAAPPTLVRNGIVHVPTCAHGEHEAGGALDASCSACATAVCNDGSHASCCTTAWTDDCAGAADACAPSTASETTDSRVFAAAATGWIEAPVDGTYLFDASAQPSRLFVNGTKLLDWFGGAGTKQGSIELMGGVRYHFRWDRFQSEPPSGGAGPGVTWQPPGAIALGPIPTGALYELSPGTGTGLAATFTDNLTAIPFSRVDPNVDINIDVAPPTPPTPAPITLPATVVLADGYTATWEGEIVPFYTENYTFTVVGSGIPTLTIGGNPVSFPVPLAGSVRGSCAHDLCVTGDKLARGTTVDPVCHPCVDDVCAHDAYCCDGGYLSYYSTLPAWDAKCVAEVNLYCAPANQCTAPLPSPVSPQQSSTAVPLVAGVHYHLLFQYDNTTLDPTTRLMWSSPRQAKAIIPQYALFPKGSIALGKGGGLNVTTFGTKTVMGVLTPDLDTVVGSGELGDLSITAPAGPDGIPVVDAIAAPEDLVAAVPPAPAIVRPRFKDTVALDSSSALDVHGIGGISTGAVHITVVEDGTDVIVPVSGDGTFATSIILGGSGTRPRTLLVSQRSQNVSPCLAPICLESASVTWPLTITDAVSGDPPVITSPADLTTSPAPVDLVVPVIGTGTPGTLTITEEGLPGATVSPTTLTIDAKGAVNSPINLSHGSPSDPNPGWHKLVFSQGGVEAPPVFVSVGIDPPTVTFPRTGAKIDCTPNAVDPREFTAKGSVPYPEAQFGPLRVAEETGRQHLQFVDRDTGVSQTPSQDGTFAFNATVALTYGRHLLYFFQAKSPPQGANVDEYYRAFASLANTPTSRIVVNVPPPRIPIPPGLAGVVSTRAFTNGRIDVGPGVATQGPPLFAVAIGACGPNFKDPSPFCAQPYADVNLRIGPRIFTVRADADGAWKLAAPVPHGWTAGDLRQVVDSPAGGAWEEGCPSNEIDFGGPSVGGPSITTPDDLTVDATSPAGAVVNYDVTAVSATTGAPVSVDCKPASGSTFPLGPTPVLCTAVEDGKVGVATFEVTVQDGAPILTVPADITAEATSAAGALVSYDVSATDAVTGDIPFSCAPASPVQSAVDIPTTVSCSATNAAGQSTTKSFQIHVADTTPPTLCTLPDLQVGTNGGAGAFVSFTPCASDIVDGANVALFCDHTSGSFFPLGTTIVNCTATDSHLNSASTQFKVSVGDTTPPVLKLPADITVPATSRRGAVVSYTVTATDNADPHTTITCTPPSGAQFPLGTTTVNCTARDASGNQTPGSFRVHVIVGWTGFLFPIANDGSTRWEHNVPLPVRFALTGPSGGIRDLTVRLFVAPIDAAGHVGAEIPAVKIPPINSGFFDFIPFINQYLFVMDTRPQGIGPWQLRVDFGDGVPHTVRVTFTR